jgi:hypothetical protein
MDNLKSTKTWAFLLIAGLVEWIIIHLLDAAKYGTAALWGKLLGIITLGSKKFQDLPYSNASLNPYPVPSLIVLFIMIAGIGAYLTARMFRMTVPVALQLLPDRWRGILQKHASVDVTEDAEAIQAKMLRNLVMKCLVYVVVLSLLELACIYNIVIISAIAIRSGYETDRDMVAPYITPDERVEIQSQFAQVNTKADFQKLMDRLQVVATKHHIKLVNPNR